MLHSFRPTDFIQLPPLGEAGTLTLVDELETAAKESPRLPSLVYATLSRVLEASAELKRHIATRERAGSSADPKARAADRALDDAWGAFQSWLLGWTKLPDRAHPRIEEARNLYRTLFAKGLQFLTLEFRDEWTESQNRLDLLARKNYGALVEALGGGAFLAELTRAHRAYGDALHITGGTREPDADVVRALDETHLALRDYVAQVASLVRRDDTTTVTVATNLLAPLSARA